MLLLISPDTEPNLLLTQHLIYYLIWHRRCFCARERQDSFSGKRASLFPARVPRRHRRIAAAVSQRSYYSGLSLFHFLSVSLSISLYRSLARSLARSLVLLAQAQYSHIFANLSSSVTCRRRHLYRRKPIHTSGLQCLALVLSLSIPHTYMT